MTSADVVVIGGGAVGVCAALELARSGARVELLERCGAVGRGCSEGSAGLLAPSHATPLATPGTLLEGLRTLGRSGSPFSIRLRPSLFPWLARFTLACRRSHVDEGTRVMRALCAKSVERHAEYAEQGIDTGFTRAGVLYVHESARSLAAAREEVTRARADGLEVEVLDERQAVAVEPALALPVAGAVLYPADAHCDAPRFVRAVAAAAADEEVRIRTGVEVTEIRRRGEDLVVQTRDGERRAGDVVLAAGSWSTRLARQLGVFLPVEPGWGYSVELTRESSDPERPLYFREERLVVTPLADRLRLSGVLELGAVRGDAEDRTSSMMAAAERLLRGVIRSRVRGTWSGPRPMSPDGLPIVGRAREERRLVLACGHGMMGMTLAPITGVAVADLVCGGSLREEFGAIQQSRFRSVVWRWRVP